MKPEDVPEELVQPVAEQMLERYKSEYNADHLTWAAFADDARADLAAVLPAHERQVREQVAAEIYADQELGRVAAPYERCIRVALGRDPDGWPDDERDVNAIMATIGTVRCGLAGPHHRHTWSEQGHGRVCPGERIARGESR